MSGLFLREGDIDDTGYLWDTTAVRLVQNKLYDALLESEASHPVRVRRKFDEADILRIRALYSCGDTYKSIAATMQCSANVVRHVVKGLGVYESFKGVDND